MTLNSASIDWAIDSILAQSDGDLFPKVLEMEAIGTQRQDFLTLVANQPLSKFPPGASRRFIVPKDEISYRQATQLDPQDSIILSAIMYEFGEGIEQRRLPRDQVFSYRFGPTISHGLYNSQNSWNEFWESAQNQIVDGQFIVYCDISDFYNQIYHHTVENQLIASGFPNQAIQWIKSLLESTTAGVSRGIPIGPHSAHLLAEATLIPVDNSMTTAGFEFVRYADDILIFVETAREARAVLSRLASILDRQQRLTLQRHKTRILPAQEAQSLCQNMIEDRPISDAEDDILKLIRRYSGGNPYVTVSYNSISQSDWLKITPEIIESIIAEYLENDPVDFIRLRWLYRRLTQLGHPGALKVSLDRIDELSPCIASICQYISSIQNLSDGEWKVIGGSLLALLESDEIADSEYFKMSILSLFSRNSHVNHFVDLAKKFDSADPYAKREILLASRLNGAEDWAREYKEAYGGMDPWQKSAFLMCAANWPRDEKKYFINQQGGDRPFENVLGKWAKAI